ncbi:TlpA family protein disulfide reductase [Aquimarina celericrescens]|uniref:TlpA family protein disulfide reductase n=1 Tax=Aquimarina celericrescens TaxID=1964542 RepID=A0ABW5AZJ0_9FLAO
MRCSWITYFTKISLLCYCFGSCTSPEENNREYTYFGGEIVNPNTNYVILSKGNGANDTIQLDRDNRFLHKIKNLEEGIYFFRHNPENQIVLIEKGDSILLRLNTLEFDESLVFTGDGARKNNFLIDMYLQNEIEREKLRRTELQLSPSYFKRNQDSLIKRKLKAYEKLTKKHELSTLAKKITQASFIFDYYTRHELYFHRRYGIGGLDSTKDLPESFFDYRKDINFNDEELKRLYSYNRYLNYYFTNSSLRDYNNEFSQYEGEIGSTVYKLDLVDSLVQNPYIKNNLLRRVTANFLLESKNDHDSNKVLNHYLSVSSNKKSQKELRKLNRAISRLRPNHPIPEQKLITANGEIIELTSLFNKPITALYFWSMDRKDHFIKSHEKASYLSALYPEIDFIAINTDDEQTKNWLKTIKRHHYNLGKEYEFKYPKCSSEELVIYNRNKVILVDKEGKIINAKADLFSSKLEKQLMKYSRLASLQNNKSYPINKK